MPANVILDPTSKGAPNHSCELPPVYTNQEDDYCKGGTWAFKSGTLLNCKKCDNWWYYVTYENCDPYLCIEYTFARWVQVKDLKRKARKGAMKRVHAYEDREGSKDRHERYLNMAG